jgi:uncharacterized protein with HEPN domain
MRPEERDAAYLWDMLDAAKTVLQFVASIRFSQYERDRKLQLAIERLVAKLEPLIPSLPLEVD